MRRSFAQAPGPDTYCAHPLGDRALVAATAAALDRGEHTRRPRQDRRFGALLAHTLHVGNLGQLGKLLEISPPGLEGMALGLLQRPLQNTRERRPSVKGTQVAYPLSVQP